MSGGNVLIYCPIAPSTPKIYGRTLQSIFNLEWPYSTNIVFGRNDNPRSHKFSDLCAKHNEARQMVLDSNYDALFLVENDMVIPPDALIRLYELDADVAYGLYCNRHGLHNWLAFMAIDGLQGGAFSATKEIRQAVWGKPVETAGVGLGCTVIRRKVLEVIEFRTHPEHKVADDWMFAEDCRAEDFRQCHHFGVHCGHIMPDGSTLWPSVDAPGGYTLEIPDDGRELAVTKDDKIVIPIGMDTISIHARNSS